MNISLLADSGENQVSLSKQKLSGFGTIVLFCTGVKGKKRPEKYPLFGLLGCLSAEKKMPLDKGKTTPYTAIATEKNFLLFCFP